MAEIDLGTLYDFNKEVMKNEKPLDPIQFNVKTNEVAQDIWEYMEDYGIQYWMLLCHERRDYTLFNILGAVDADPIIKELRPTLTNRGQILSIDKQPDKAWEIWIRDIETEENFAYYLFQYDTGVIEINDQKEKYKMNNIVILFQPFVLKQKVIAYNNQECVSQYEVNIDEIPTLVETLTKENTIDSVKITGHRDYINKYQAEIVSKIPTNIKINIL